MSLLQYRVDLRGVSDEEHNRIEQVISGWAETGLALTRTLRVYTCFIDEKISVNDIPGLPAGVIQRIP